MTLSEEQQEHHDKVNEARRLMMNMMEQIANIPNEEINYIIFSVGTSPIESPTISSHNILGGNPQTILEALQLLMQQTLENAPPEAVIGAIKTIMSELDPDGFAAKIKLAGMKPQGNA